MKKLLFLFSVLTLLITACTKDDDFDVAAQRAADSQTIQQFLADNNLNADSTDSGLHYIISDPGSGNGHPTANSRVQIKYKGTLVDGTVFDETKPGQSITIDLRGVIDGWKEGIPLYTKGGEGKLIIPSHLGYGRRGAGLVPPNAVLIFDIELLDF